LLERSFTAQQLQNFQGKYSISLPPKDGKREVGLMDIRKISKTKPFQKASSIRNWKVNSFSKKYISGSYLQNSSFKNSFIQLNQKTGNTKFSNINTSIMNDQFLFFLLIFKEIV
jgi:hypothetical protein